MQWSCQQHVQPKDKGRVLATGQGKQLRNPDLPCMHYDISGSSMVGILHAWTSEDSYV